MKFLPIFLDVNKRFILVDGGGTIAARRVEAALKANANVIVFNEELNEEFLPFFDSPNFKHVKRSPKETDFKNCLIAYGASEDAVRDKLLFNAAHKAGALVNVADVAKYCDFITPSIVDRSPMIVAISSSGKTPVIARILRARIESLIPPAYGKLADFLGSFRGKIAAKINNHVKRRHFWENIIEGKVSNLFLLGNENEAEKQLNDELEVQANNNDKIQIGEVFLVGAGPGDPDLLTFRALRLMQRCDIVLYDRLVSADILNLVRRDAKRINVGKRLNDHTMAQEEISQLMVDLAKKGKRVLRLKGGDPFLFGRGGEEIELLGTNNIPFQIIPGITAATGCSAYAGIPLTHRDYAQSCIFITAHGKDGALDLDWKALLRPSQTIVVYMGLNNLKKLSEEFIAHGADINIPVALIENGTRRDQRVITGTFNDINDKAIAENFQSPALIIIGNVVKLHKKLHWSAEEENAEHQMSLKAQETL